MEDCGILRRRAAGAARTRGAGSVPPIRRPRFHGNSAWHRPHYTIWTGSGDRVDLEQLVARAAEAHVVLLGEEHDDRVGHAVQLEVLQALQSCLAPAGRRLALAMEMFEVDVQPVLDEYLAGQVEEREFLSVSRAWSNFQTDYRPLVEFAKDHTIEVVASNAPRRHVGLAGRQGANALAALPSASRALLPPLPIPPPSAEYRDIFFANMAPNVGSSPSERSECPHVAANSSKLQQLLEAQTLWDASMAYRCARWAVREGGEGGLVVHLNGNFHSRGRRCVSSGRSACRCVHVCHAVFVAGGSQSDWKATLQMLTSSGMS
eukprot:SAG31_NODE_5578_length_2447_cov_1.292589_2_plen_319_part_00